MAPAAAAAPVMIHAVFSSKAPIVLPMAPTNIASVPAAPAPKSIASKRVSGTYWVVVNGLMVNVRVAGEGTAACCLEREGDSKSACESGGGGGRGGGGVG